MSDAQQDRNRNQSTAGEKAKPIAKEERKLDKALAESFPASDPVQPACPTGDDDGPRGRIDRQTPKIDKQLVNDLAREIRREVG